METAYCTIVQVYYAIYQDSPTLKYTVQFTRTFSTFKYIIDLPGLTIIRAAITRLLIYISIIICPIDDIIWLSYDNESTEKIEQALTNTCMEYELKLTFRKVNTNETGKRLEFLDVLHMIDNSNKFGLFYYWFY